MQLHGQLSSGVASAGVCGTESGAAGAGMARLPLLLRRHRDEPEPLHWVPSVAAAASSAAACGTSVQRKVPQVLLSGMALSEAQRQSLAALQSS